MVLLLSPHFREILGTQSASSEVKTAHIKQGMNVKYSEGNLLLDFLIAF